MDCYSGDITEELVASIKTKFSNPSIYSVKYSRKLHGKSSKKPQNYQDKNVYKEKYYYTNMAHLINEWVMSCEQCIEESRIDWQISRFPLQNSNQYNTAPEHTKQIYFVPELIHSGSYQNIATAMDVSSSYFFSYPISGRDAKTFAKVIIDIMIKHAHLPRTLISDKGSAFISRTIKEVAGVHGITLKHAKTKHAQMVGVLERPHASVKQAVNIEKGERRCFWHKYVKIAVLNYNKLYHSSIGCEPSTVLDERTPSNILDLERGIHPQEIPTPNSHIAQDFFELTEMIFQDVRKNAMQCHVKYKAYYVIW